jgi:Rrf2 family protein
MRVSTKGRYSLEAILYMALLPEGEYVSTRSIAGETGISDGYLEQLFIPLRRAGIIRGVRGPQGGYCLGKPRKDISVGDVLRIMEGSLEPVNCLKSRLCPAAKKCNSRRIWDELYGEISACVDAISLEDLVEAYENLDQLEYTI